MKTAQQNTRSAKGRTRIIQKRLQSATWLQKIILAVCLLCLLPFWPLGLVREDVEQRSKDASHQIADPLAPGDSLTQSFRASHGTLKALDFVLECDDGQPKNGTLLFQLTDAGNHVLYSEELPYSQIGGYRYHRVDLNLSLKWQRLYTYRITNLDITENMPRPVYTSDPSMHAAPNRRMTLKGEEIQGAALTRYTWNAPLRLHYVLAIAGFIGTVGFTLTEAAGPGRKQGKEDPRKARRL